MVGDDLYTKLAADATLTDLVATRIYPDQAPTRATRPYVVYRRELHETTYHMGGAIGPKVSRFALETYASSRRLAWQAAEAIRALLDGFRGTLGSATTVRGTFFEDESDDAIAPADASEQLTYRVTQDVALHHA